MINKENLVLDIRPDQLIPYNNLQVAFYDGYKNKVFDKNGKITSFGEPALYIHIENSQDRYSVTSRLAGEKRNKRGDIAKEIKLFPRAYAKYLEIKKNGGLVDDEKVALASKNDVLMAKIAKMEADAAKELSSKTKIVDAKKKSKY